MSDLPEQEQRPQPAREIYIRLPDATPLAVYGIIAFTVLVYLTQILSAAFWGYAITDLDWLLVLGGRINAAILEGQLWRLITPIFLHFSLSHIFFNMYALLSIGSFLERQLGRGRFLALYFLGGFAGNVFSFLFTRNGISAGASGAVFAVAAAQGVFFYQNRELFGAHAGKALKNTAVLVGINVFIGMSLGFDNWGHIGGLLGGAMFAWLGGTQWKAAGLPPELHVEDQREARQVWTAAAVTLVVFAALALLGMQFKIN